MSRAAARPRGRRARVPSDRRRGLQPGDRRTGNQAGHVGAAPGDRTKTIAAYVFGQRAIERNRTADAAQRQYQAATGASEVPGLIPRLSWQRLANALARSPEFAYLVAGLTCAVGNGMR